MNQRFAALKKICRHFGIAILYAFGSQAENLRNWIDGQLDRLPEGQSDVDIGVKRITGERWSVKKKVHLAGAMERFFGCPRVDLVFLQEADPFLAAEIIRGERLFARDEYEADEYDLYILRRAGDLVPLERERMALVLGELP
jgi:predicted nucleotidyltransferase